MNDSASLEGLLSGAGSALASAAALVIVLAIFQGTGGPNALLALEAAATEVGGDINVLASSAVPFNESHRYSFDGIGLNISSDYVAASEGGETFARRLATGICPGSYADEGAAWESPDAFVQYLNRTFCATGTRELPLNGSNASAARALLDRARRQMALQPLVVDQGKPVMIEKMSVFSRNEGSRELEAESYVFVYQR